MKTNIINLVRLSEEEKELAATKIQMDLIFGLMVTRGLGEVFHQHFFAGNTVSCNRLTKTSANTLISVLRGQKSDVQALKFKEVYSSQPKSELGIRKKSFGALSNSGNARRIKEQYINMTGRLKRNMFRISETLK